MTTSSYRSFVPSAAGAGLRALVVVLFGVILLAFLLAAASPAYAYDYKVRLWAGNEGTVNGSTKYDEITVEPGSDITLSEEFEVKATNEKYYVKGFRPGGADNQQRVSDADNHSNGKSNLRDAITVNEDMDFVVAYGVKGKMVEYTLNFVEQGTGKTLHKSITRVGAVGDKPVAAYEYVEGYRPLYKNITGTLQESGNKWTFEYVKEGSGGASSSTTGGGATGGGTTGGGGATGGGATGGGATGGGATGGGATGGGTTGASTTAGTEGTQGTQGSAATPPQTEEILDIDTPLAQLSSSSSGGSSSSSSSSSSSMSSSSSSSGTTEQGGGIPLPAIIALAVAAAGGVGAVFFLLKRRQEEAME